MRVGMYYNNRDVRVEEMPVPRIGRGELLVQVVACGICGSDVLEWYRLPRAPLVLGHELAGEIAAVGEGVKDFQVGDRVAVSHHVPCNTCPDCLRGNHTACPTLLRGTRLDPGGFSEFTRVPAINVEQGVFLLPQELSCEEATFAEPLGCVLRGQRRANMQPGRHVLVMGCGTAGLLHIQLARYLGAASIMATDLVDYRLKAAREFGADMAVPATEDVPARLRQLNHDRLADLVVVCTGAQAAIAQGLQCVERGGTVLLFAPSEPQATITISLNDLFWPRQATLTSSYAASPDDFQAALELLRSRRVQVRPMITHWLPLAEIGQGFQIVARAGESIKVIINPQQA